MRGCEVVADGDAPTNAQHPADFGEQFVPGWGDRQDQVQDSRVEHPVAKREVFAVGQEELDAAGRSFRPRAAQHRQARIDGYDVCAREQPEVASGAGADDEHSFVGPKVQMGDALTSQ